MYIYIYIYIYIYTHTHSSMYISALETAGLRSGPPARGDLPRMSVHRFGTGPFEGAAFLEKMLRSVLIISTLKNWASPWDT